MEPSSERRTRLILVLGCALACALPNIYASIAATDSMYLGVQYNTDDHMVYASWTRQAMEGSFLFDNRFTTDSQPGLSFHLYFLLVGWLAKILGIQLASSVARVAFSGLFVWLLWNFVRRLAKGNGFIQRAAPLLAVFGAGVGFLAWHTFGTDIVRPAPIVGALTGGRLPTDVWQPEGFGLPSMLTSGLFAASLCLILVTLSCVLDAKKSWRPVLPGALAYGVLMNIHSYDALLVALVLVGLLAMGLAQRHVTWAWVARTAAIGAGALPAALWFLHVLRTDPVFQARVATPTFSPNFRAVVFGYLGLIVLALVGVWMARKSEEGTHPRRTIGALALIGLLCLGFLAASGHTGGYWMEPAAWGAALAAAVVALMLVARPDPAWNLIAAWAVIGTLALYFPALFQRKLAMGLAIPWALLAALALEPILARADAGKRQLAGVLVALIVGASSVRWTGRQFWFIRNNVSNTTVHPVFVGPDVSKALEFLGDLPSRRVVTLAMPGVAAVELDEQGNPVPDGFASPYMPDLNPILVGLAGTYAYAGHWSETPDYGRRRDRLTRFFLAQTSPEQRQALLVETGADYVLAPVPEAFPNLGLADLTTLGEVVQDGTQFRLIKLAQ